MSSSLLRSAHSASRATPSLATLVARTEQAVRPPAPATPVEATPARRPTGGRREKVPAAVAAVVRRLRTEERKGATDIAALVGLSVSTCARLLRGLPLTPEERRRGGKGGRPRLAADVVTEVRRLRTEEQLPTATISERTGVKLSTCASVLRGLRRVIPERVPAEQVAEVRRLRTVEGLSIAKLIVETGLPERTCRRLVKGVARGRASAAPQTSAPQTSVAQTSVARVRHVCTPAVVAEIRRLRVEDRLGTAEIAARVGMPAKKCQVLLLGLPLTTAERKAIRRRAPEQATRQDLIAEARRLRREEQLTVREIGARLQVHHSLCAPWVADLPRTTIGKSSATVIAEVRRLRIEERRATTDIAERVGISRARCVRLLRDLPLTAEERAVHARAHGARRGISPAIAELIRRLRRDDRLGTDEIVARTGVNKTTCVRLLRDLPLTPAEAVAKREAGRRRAAAAGTGPTRPRTQRTLARDTAPSRAPHDALARQDAAVRLRVLERLSLTEIARRTALPVAVCGEVLRDFPLEGEDAASAPSGRRAPPVRPEIVRPVVIVLPPDGPAWRLPMRTFYQLAEAPASMARTVLEALARAADAAKRVRLAIVIIARAFGGAPDGVLGVGEMGACVLTDDGPRLAHEPGQQAPTDEEVRRIAAVLAGAHASALAAYLAAAPHGRCCLPRPLERGRGTPRRRVERACTLLAEARASGQAAPGAPPLSVWYPPEHGA